MQTDLFTTNKVQVIPEAAPDNTKDVMPLATRIRPTTLDTFFGQSHILGEGKLLQRLMQADKLQSAIFFGPSGSGKTTIGLIIAKITHCAFFEINAVQSNSSELRAYIDHAKKIKQLDQVKTVLFIDEIHRFNKAQQDILMPAIEHGDIVLIGATTHNPTFSLNGPLLSRSLVFEFKPLGEGDIIRVLENALLDTKNGFGERAVRCEKEALTHIARQSSGDARRALNALEVAVLTTQPDTSDTICITKHIAEESIQRKIVCYDKDEDGHYDTISAFIKSMRGSDPDAAVYWLAKMIYAGEEPLFILRRMMIFASEDIGNADPHALLVAVNALQAFQCVGLPEGRIILGQAVTYLASAPKSNASYLAIDEALHDVTHAAVEEVPIHIRGKESFSKKDLDKKNDYKYPHSYAQGVVDQRYRVNEKKYYRPQGVGYEKRIKERLDAINKMKGEVRDDH